MLAARGPCVSGTRADYVKFHDDKARASHAGWPELSRRPEGLQLHTFVPSVSQTSSACCIWRTGWQVCKLRADAQARPSHTLARPHSYRRCLALWLHMGVHGGHAFNRARTRACTRAAAPPTWTRPRT